MSKPVSTTIKVASRAALPGLAGFALAFFTLACASAPQASQGGHDPERRVAAGAEHEDPCPPATLGRWRVVGHRIPGLSALSEDQALAWHGKRAVFEMDYAVFDGERCDEPAYASRMMTPAQLGQLFRLPLSALDLPGAEICVTEIGCPEAWAAPGSFLIHAAERLLTTWDGVFFELARE